MLFVFFYRVVWKGSKQVGIGVAFKTNDDGKGQTVVVVAQYTPPGNWNNDYKNSVLPASS